MCGGLVARGYQRSLIFDRDDASAWERFIVGRPVVVKAAIGGGGGDDLYNDDGLGDDFDDRSVPALVSSSSF